MKQLKRLLVVIGLIGGLTFAAVPSVGAIDVFQACSADSTSAVCAGKSETVTNYIPIIVNTILFILGAVAVVIIIYAGILYVTSTGDAARIKRAKDTLTYAIVGLIVAILAFAIVNFVLGTFAPKPAPKSTTPAVISA